MTHSPIAALLAASSLLAACAAQPPAVAGASMTVDPPELQAACADVARIDLARIPAAEDDWSWVEPLHRRARPGTVLAPTGPTVIRSATPAAGIAAPAFDVSIHAARLPDGRWLVSKARHLAVPPPPQGPQDLDAQGRRIIDPALRSGEFKRGYLDVEIGRKLDRALASDCLRIQPASEPSPLPLKGGGEMQCPPDAGSRHALEIRDAAGMRRFTHSCARSWASGYIIILLESSRLTPA